MFSTMTRARMAAPGLAAMPRREVLMNYLSATIRENRFNNPDRKKYYENQKFDASLAKTAYMSLAVISVPYIFVSSNLLISSSLGVDPYLFSSVVLTRNLIKWTSLHIAINGGVHYGLAEIKHEIGPSESLKPAERKENVYDFDPKRHPIPYMTYLQAIYSFVPALAAYNITNMLLFGDIAYFDPTSLLFGLVGLQVMTCGIDMACTWYKLLPSWYGKYRLFT